MPSSREWSVSFRDHVERLPEWVYLIKLVKIGMSGYDAFYQKIITDFELDTVTVFFSM